MVFGLFSKRWNPDGKHVYITGGSSGLGLALAKLLVTKGAHVSIVARNQENLDSALAELEKLRRTPSQILQAQSHSLNSASTSSKALDSVCEAFDGEAPDAVFTCAGASKPMFFLEMTEEDLTSGMDSAYWVQAWTAWASAKKMAKQRKEGSKIVLISSAGDTLQSELMLYNIDELTRPAIVKKIEESDDGAERGDAHITGDILASAAHRSNRGMGVGIGWIIDGVLDFVAFIAMPVWRSGVDRQVRGHRKEHEEYLTQKASLLNFL
ncbi:oxidoreductase, partial [Coprinopsis sp. MPI-PUGE-AT-0042]